MSNRKLVLKIVLFLMFFAGVVSATTYYVDPCGTDEDGLSWESAFLSIQQGIDEANDGDIVMVGPGTYIGGLNYDGKAITLTGTDPNDWDVVKSTIIDCNGSLAEPNNILFINSEDANSVLTGLTVTGGYGVVYNGRNYGGAVQCRGSSPQILRCIFHGNTNDIEDPYPFGGAIACLEGANPLIDSCIFYDNDCAYGGGICIMDNSSAVIRNSLFYDHKNSWGGSGIGNYFGTDVEITNCTVVNNVSYDLHHLSFGGGIDSVFAESTETITNCIVWGNGDDLLGCTAEYSCIEDNDEGEGVIHDDPQFIDPSTGNYGISCFSPCINAGDTSANAGLLDIDGDSRVIYGRVDIGADEKFPAAFDLDPDGEVNFFDFAVFAEHWLEGVE